MKREVKATLKTIQETLNVLGNLFEPGAKLTFVVRMPEELDAGLVITDDTVDGAIEALKKYKSSLKILDVNHD